MAKGVSIKFKSYSETIPKLLEVLKFDKEIKKHEKIILKPHLASESSQSTSAAFVEQVLRFCLIHKSPSAKVYIAEGADGVDTEELFSEYGYKKLAEKYDVALVDLNHTETVELAHDNFLRFAKIYYPKVLYDGFLVSLPKLSAHEELEMIGSLSGMLGAFPGELYKGFLTRRKNKIRQWPLENSVYDINQCKTPNFALVDASDNGVILAGLPFEVDKQAAKLLGKELSAVPYLRLFEEFTDKKIIAEKVEEKKQ